MVKLYTAEGNVTSIEAIILRESNSLRKTKEF